MINVDASIADMPAQWSTSPFRRWDTYEQHQIVFHYDRKSDVPTK
jgi:hypothetical protein